MYLTLYQEDCCSELCSKSDSSRMDSPEPSVQHWTTKSTYALQDTQLRVDMHHCRIKLSYDTCMNPRTTVRLLCHGTILFTTSEVLSFGAFLLIRHLLRCVTMAAMLYGNFTESQASLQT